MTKTILQNEIVIVQVGRVRGSKGNQYSHPQKENWFTGVLIGAAENNSTGPRGIPVDTRYARHVQTATTADGANTQRANRFEIVNFTSNCRAHLQGQVPIL